MTKFLQWYDLRLCMNMKLKKNNCIVSMILHHNFKLPHSAPSWILSRAENLTSSILQDGAMEWHYS